MASRLLARNSQSSSLTVWQDDDGRWASNGQRVITESRGISFSAWMCATLGEALTKVAHEVMKADGELPMAETKGACHIHFGIINAEKIRVMGTDIKRHPEPLPVITGATVHVFHTAGEAVRLASKEAPATPERITENALPVPDTLFALHLTKGQLSWDRGDAPGLPVGTAVIVLDVHKRLRGLYLVKEVLCHSPEGRAYAYIVISPFGKELCVARHKCAPLPLDLYQFPRLSIGMAVTFSIDGRLMEHAGKVGTIIAATWHDGLLSIRYDVALDGERITCAAWEVIDMGRLKIRASPWSASLLDGFQRRLAANLAAALNVEHFLATSENDGAKLDAGPVVTIRRPMCVAPGDKVILGEQFGADAGMDATVSEILQENDHRILVTFMLAGGRLRRGIGYETAERPAVIIR